MTRLLNKPSPIALLNRTDPLMKGLVCASALNEPGGVSRNLVSHGLLVGTPAAGGLATNLTSGHEPWYNGLGSGYTFVLWHSGITLGSWEALLAISDGTLAWQRYSTSNYFKCYHNGSGQTMSNFLLSEIVNPALLVCLWDGAQMRAYVDAVQVGSVAMAADPKTNSTSSTLTIGGSCTVHQFLVYDRALSTDEIQRLSREPLALFKEASAWPPVLVAGSVTHDLAGSIGVATQLSAAVKVTRCIAGATGDVSSLSAALRLDRAISGSCSAQANLAASLSTTGTVTLAGSVSAMSLASGSLTVTSSQPEATQPSEMDWLSEALFHGATASAFQLGTVLSGGWFWMRRDECMAVYRGPSMAQVDFDNVLCVVMRECRQIVLPDYLQHEPNTRYCYVVRCFNPSGHSERTLGAAVVIRFDAAGQLVEPMPNDLFGLRADPVADHKVRLAWFYCPLDHEAEPEVFRIYTDNGAGQIDFETPMASLLYEGRKLYCYRTQGLPDGLYRFAVVAERQGQADRVCLSSVRCPIRSRCPEGVTILDAEAIS